MTRNEIDDLFGKVKLGLRSNATKKEREDAMDAAADLADAVFATQRRVRHLESLLGDDETDQP